MPCELQFSHSIHCRATVELYSISAETLRQNEDVKELYLGLGAAGRRSYRDVKHYRRRKRWLA